MAARQALRTTCDENSARRSLRHPEQRARSRGLAPAGVTWHQGRKDPARVSGARPDKNILHRDGI